ncbi:hypothetical protein FJT64_013967 [Amphibalanus amphitrite]|uniref:Uncharacterized protein n=1 Tax=Amphibalanus amphitrite TaxID=1232801 RepID=A0A6A4UV38_AMPAM|nr:hypothetical protein FJT64_013967 [Amphibalanus amphitrite]
MFQPTMVDLRVCAGPAALLLLLAVTLAGPRPAATAVFFFSRDEVTPAPPPTPTTAPCVCSLADWCRPLFKPKTEVNEGAEADVSPSGCSPQSGRNVYLFRSVERAPAGQRYSQK